METERGQSPEYILKCSKKTQYLMNTLYFFAVMLRSMASFVYSPVSENYKQIRFLFHLYFFFINLAIQNLFLPSMSVSMYIIYKLFMHTGEAFFFCYLLKLFLC